MYDTRSPTSSPIRGAQLERTHSEEGGTSTNQKRDSWVAYVSVSNCQMRREMPEPPQPLEEVNRDVRALLDSSSQLPLVGRR